MVWKKKLFANLFLYKLRPELEQIAQGIQVFLPGKNNPILMKGILLIGTADLLAKNQFMNFVQFNSDYGCPTCCTKGENCMQLMGGVIKKLLSLMFDLKHSAKPFSLHAVKDIINSRLTSIKPPKFMHRVRSVDELLHWKVSELKMWCFFNSIPVLEGVLRQDYFEHYLLLVTTITLLNSEKITPFMLNVAENFLNKFAKEFETLYGLNFCSINIHQLLHLPDCVRRLGPLWTFSCFEYENINDQLLKLVHGTNHIDTQIARSHDRRIKMIQLIDQLPENSI